MDLLLRFNVPLSQKHIDFMNNVDGNTVLTKLIRLSHLNPNVFRNIINEYCKINPHHYKYQQINKTLNY